MTEKTAESQGNGNKPLALHGGKPVRSTYLPYGRHTIDKEDIQAVVQVLESDWLTTGPTVSAFEDAVASRLGAEHAVAFSSGTGALHAAAAAAGLGPGDEAITTPLTFAATANAALYQGAKPVLVDVDPETLTLDPGPADRHVTPNTRAILPVDYAGHPADLDAFLNLAEENDLIVIEDACHALGAEYKQRKVGNISHMTVFSLHPVKHVTTGEGGIVTTNDENLAGKLRRFRHHGIDPEPEAREKIGPWYYEMVALGYNYRLSDVNCALGISQLAKLDENLRRRREIAARYAKAFEGIPGFVRPPVRGDVDHAWHLYPIRVASEELRATRGEVFKALRAENIGVQVHYIPVHLHPYYRERLGHAPGDYPAAEAAYERLISIPMFHGMTDEDVDDVIAAVRKVATHYAA